MPAQSHAIPAASTGDVNGYHSSARVVPVEVVSDSGSVCIVSPRGYRVEGLSLSDAAALLRELS